VSVLSDFNQNWIWSTDFSKNHQRKISRKSVQWEPSYSMSTDWRTHTMSLFTFLLRTRLKMIGFTHRVCFVLSVLSKSAGDESVRSLFTLFSCSYTTFVITATAWMACVIIMLTSRWNESTTMHSMHRKVLDSCMFLRSIAIRVEERGMQVLYNQLGADGVSCETSLQML
jgi:hypothetical protein